MNKKHYGIIALLSFAWHKHCFIL